MVKLSLSEDNQNLHTVELSYQAAPGKIRRASPAPSTTGIRNFCRWPTPRKHPLTGCTIHLAPGTYEYKFVVDGEWVLDESNPNFAANDFGTLNSVINVG